MFYCPNCNNTLSITQQGPNDAPITTDNLSETPVTISASSQEQENSELKNIPKQTIMSNSAYFKCLNCGFVQGIEPGTLILSRPSEKAISDYTADITKYKDMVYDMTLPHTRKYICPNNLCKSHNNHSLREAVWFKPSRFSYSIIHICKECHTMW